MDGCEAGLGPGDAGDFVLTRVLGASGLPALGDATGATGATGAAGAAGAGEGFGAGEGALDVADLGAGDFGVALAGDLGVALGVSVAGGFTEGAGEAFGLSFTEIIDFGVATDALGLDISF